MRRVALLLLMLSPGCDGVRRAVARPAAAAEAVEVDTSATARRLLGTAAVDSMGFAPSEFALLPDGRTALGTDWNTGDVFLVDLVTHERLRNLTSNSAPFEPGYGFDLRVSPDGRRVVYWWVVGHKVELHVADLPDGAPRRVREYPPSVKYLFAWMPGSDSVAAAVHRPDMTFDLVLLPVTAGEPRTLRRLGRRAPDRVAFSPDARFLLYDLPASDESTLYDIFSLEVATGRQQPFAVSSADDRLLGWAPGTDQVLFASDRLGTPGAWLQRVAVGRPAGDPVLVKPDLWGATGIGFNAEGDYLYGVTVGGMNVFTAPIDLRTGVLGPMTPLFAQPWTGNAPNLAWSPDGSSLAVRINSRRRSSVVVRSLSGDAAREYPVVSAVGTHVQWLSDGSAVLMGGLDTDWEERLLRLDLATGRTVTLREGNGSGWFAEVPGAHSVVLYHCFPRGVGVKQRVQLLLRKLDTGAERVIAEQEGCRLGWFAVSPDGKRVAYYDDLRTRDYSLVVLSLEDGRIERVAGAPHLYGLGWDATGNRLYGTTFAKTPVEFIMIGLDGSMLFRTALEHDRAVNLKLSPRGDRIAYGAGRTREELWRLENLPLKPPPR